MRRLAQHRSGALDGFTARHQVKRLVFYEQCGDMARAIARGEDRKWIEQVAGFALVPHAVYYL